MTRYLCVSALLQGQAKSSTAADVRLFISRIFLPMPLFVKVKEHLLLLIFCMVIKKVLIIFKYDSNAWAFFSFVEEQKNMHLELTTQKIETKTKQKQKTKSLDKNKKQKQATGKQSGGREDKTKKESIPLKHNYTYATDTYIHT